MKTKAEISLGKWIDENKFDLIVIGTGILMIAYGLFMLSIK